MPMTAESSPIAMRADSGSDDGRDNVRAGEDGLGVHGDLFRSGKLRCYWDVLFLLPSRFSPLAALNVLKVVLQASTLG